MLLVAILSIVLEEREGGFDVTLLESRLAVEAQVPSLCEESAASRVGVNACQVNLAFLSKVAHEGCVLISVGQKTASKNTCCHERKGSCKSNSLFHLYYKLR